MSNQRKEDESETREKKTSVQLFNIDKTLSRV